MPEDDTVGYFKGLAAKTEPLRNKVQAAKPSVSATPKAAETKGVLKYDDDDLKYMSKQAYKIGERLSRSASERLGKTATKRSAVKQSPKR